jgi:transposase
MGLYFFWISSRMYNMHFIKKVLSQRTELSIRKLAQKYDIGTSTIQNWIKGKFPQGTRNKGNSKLGINELTQDVIDYPDAYQSERAKRLGVSESCVWYNLKKLGITYKKKP